MNTMLVFREQLLKFLGDPDQRTLVLRGGAVERGLALNLLQSIEEEAEAPGMVMAIHEFNDASDWLDEWLPALREQRDVANQLRLAHGLEPWPDWSESCEDGSASARHRLQSIIEQCATKMTGAGLAWVLLPSMCSDIDGYASMVGFLLDSEPSKYKHKYVLWDAAEKPLLLPDSNQGHALAWNLDFSPADSLAQWVKAAQNPRTPDEQRADLLLMLAATDLAHSRFDAANEKLHFLVALDHQKNPRREVMALGLMGDVATRQEDPALALTRYRNALGRVLTIESPEPIVVLPILSGAARACVSLKDFDEALGYSMLAKGFAAKALNVTGLVEVLDEQAGILRELAIRDQDDSRVGEALQNYRAAQGLSAKFGLESQWTLALEHEIALLEEGSDARALEEARSRLEAGFGQAKAPEDHASLIRRGYPMVDSTATPSMREIR